jgi:hypothetical protein
VETELLVEALSSNGLSFIEINYLPSLVSIVGIVSVSGSDDNCLAFLILWGINLKNLVVGWVHEESVLELENLEPSWIGRPDLHVSGSSCTLNIPWLVVVSSSDGLRLLVEVEDLGLSSVGSLDDHVSVVNEVKISSTWQGWDYVEISFDVKSESCVHLLGLWFRVLIDVDNFPLLSEVGSSGSNLDISVFHVSVQVLVLNFNNLSFLIDDKSVLISE